MQYHSGKGVETMHTHLAASIHLAKGLWRFKFCLLLCCTPKDCLTSNWIGYESVLHIISNSLFLIIRADSALIFDSNGAKESNQLDGNVVFDVMQNFESLNNLINCQTRKVLLVQTLTNSFRKPNFFNVFMLSCAYVNW